MRITHVVVTGSFAGTERYVCDVARGSAVLGHAVAVVGGDPERMRSELGADVDWLPGADLGTALRSLRRLPRADVVHSHLTAADTAAALMGLLRPARHVSTRHIADRRGRSRAGALAAPWLRRAVDQQLAISDFVAAAVDGPSAVVRNAVRSERQQAPLTDRSVLVCQRLEPEKETAVALRAFAASGLATSGWRLVVAGEGAERPDLERLAGALRVAEDVDFLGFVADVRSLMLRSGVLLATATAEPLGLTVLEAMALGLPVVATASGGHLETVGTVPGAVLFPPGDADGAAAALRRLAQDPEATRAYGARGRGVQQERFDLEDHVRQVLRHYAPVASA